MIGLWNPSCGNVLYCSPRPLTKVGCFESRLNTSIELFCLVNLQPPPKDIDFWTVRSDAYRTMKGFYIAAENLIEKANGSISLDLQLALDRLIASGQNARPMLLAQVQEEANHGHLYSLTRFVRVPWAPYSSTQSRLETMFQEALQTPDSEFLLALEDPMVRLPESSLRLRSLYMDWIVTRIETATQEVVDHITRRQDDSARQIIRRDLADIFRNENAESNQWLRERINTATMTSPPPYEILLCDLFLS